MPGILDDERGVPVFHAALAREREARVVLRRALGARPGVRIEDYDGVGLVRLCEVLAGVLRDAERAGDVLRADLAATILQRERQVGDLEAQVRELRANGAKTDLQAARRAIARYGAPPPGEGTHPLQGHRDSMG